jgi:hypothetical protein
LTTLEATADYLQFKLYVSEVINTWIDKHSTSFPDLYLWKKMQAPFLSGQAGPNPAPPLMQQELFSEKYHSLRIYRVIFDRNQGELERIQNEFLKLEFECVETRRLMQNDDEAVQSPRHDLCNPSLI